MNKQKRKGFTIVELVIVIAVIAILSAVLIPTFANITEKANDSAALQQARIAYTNYMADEDFVDGNNDLVIAVDTDNDNDYDCYFAVVNGQFQTAKHDAMLDAAKVALGNNALTEAGYDATAQGVDEGGEVYVVAEKA